MKKIITCVILIFSIGLLSNTASAAYRYGICRYRKKKLHCRTNYVFRCCSKNNVRQWVQCNSVNNCDCPSDYQRQSGCKFRDSLLTTNDLTNSRDSSYHLISYCADLNDDAGDAVNQKRFHLIRDMQKYCKKHR